MVVLVVVVFVLVFLLVSVVVFRDVEVAWFYFRFRFQKVVQILVAIPPTKWKRLYRIRIPGCFTSCFHIFFYLNSASLQHR